MRSIIQHSWFQGGDLRREFDLGWFKRLLDYPVDLVFADPPYNYGVKYDGDDTRDNLKDDDYRNWVDHVLFALKNLVKDRGMIWWLSPAEHGGWLWPMIRKYGTLLYGKPVIYYERFSQYQQERLTSDYRLLWPIVVSDAGKRPDIRTPRLHVQPAVFNPDAIREPSVRQEMGDKRADPRGRVPGHVWGMRRLQGTSTDRVDWHPAQLAPEALERIVLGWTSPGDTVLDAFAGSGSMGLVCRKHQRYFIGVEQSAEYCRLIRERIDDDRS